MISRIASASGVELVCAIVGGGVTAGASIGIDGAPGTAGGPVASGAAGLLSCDVGRSDWKDSGRDAVGASRRHGVGYGFRDAPRGRAWFASSR